MLRIQTRTTPSRLTYVLALIVAFLSVMLIGNLFAQGTDTTVVDTTGTGGGVVPSVMSLAELLGWASAIVGAWLFKKWNVAQGKLDGISNFAKAAAATALVAIIAFIAKEVGFLMTGTGADLTQTGFSSFVEGLGATLLVRFGITSAKQKALVAPKAPDPY